MKQSAHIACVVYQKAEPLLLKSCPTGILYVSHLICKDMVTIFTPKAAQASVAQR